MFGSRRWLAVLVLRALSLLVFAELSGLSHTALDVTGVAHADEDCDDEQDHECPPGCPNCHCWHAGLATPPLVREDDALESAPVVADREVLPPAYERAQPPAPDQSTLYRPPRALAFL